MSKVLPAMLLVLFELVGLSAAEDWSQAGANAARISHVSDEPVGPFRLGWWKYWDGETISPIVQPVIGGGAAYLGTENGTVHAVSLADGTERWTSKLGAPIVHALACDGKRVYAATFSGTVHALAMADGKQDWAKKLSRRGFAAAPLLLGEMVIVANRDGICYCLHSATGECVWQRDTGAPICMTPAGSRGKVVLVNIAMQVFCLDAASGKVLWKAGPLPASWKRNDFYWPVIYKDKIIISLGPGESWRQTLEASHFGDVLKPNTMRFKAKSVADIVGPEQDIIQAFMKAHPKYRSLIVLNLADGKEPYTCSVIRGCGENGQTVAVAGDGNVYTVFYTSAANDAFQGYKPTHCGIGRLDLATGRLAEPLLCVPDEFGMKLGLARTPCELTHDEPVPLASGGNLLFAMRTNQTPGAIHVKTRQTSNTPTMDTPRGCDIHPATGGPVISSRHILYTKFSYLVCVEGH